MNRILLVFSACFLLSSCEKERPERPASSGPPANAEYVGESPVGIIRAVVGSKDPAAADEFIGKWNGEGGWDGELKEITEDKSGTVLRIYNYESTLIGGGYWILAIVGDNPDVEKGKLVRVQGKIKEVSGSAKGANMIIRIVLEDARVIK
jgi:hypothetical protein